MANEPSVTHSSQGGMASRMSLLDYFAARALNGLLSSHKFDTFLARASTSGLDTFQATAMAAYEIAAAMITEGARRRA